MQLNRICEPTLRHDSTTEYSTTLLRSVYDVSKTMLRLEQPSSLGNHYKHRRSQVIMFLINGPSKTRALLYPYKLSISQETIYCVVK